MLINGQKMRAGFRFVFPGEKRDGSLPDPERVENDYLWKQKTYRNIAVAIAVIDLVCLVVIMRRRANSELTADR